MARTLLSASLAEPSLGQRTRVSPIVAGSALVAIAVALAAGVFLGIASQDSGLQVRADAPVAESSVDVGFSRDMRDHHAQAVDMSVLVRDATDDPAVRTLALDITLTQQQQLGQMFGWLSAWGYPQAGAGTAMSWMAEDNMGGQHHGTTEKPMEPMRATRMPGMATVSQLQALRLATGDRAERIYLQLMIPHHRAGVMMAQYAAKNATQPQVRALAQSIVDAQSAELKVLRSMLKDRGGPVPSL